MVKWIAPAVLSMAVLGGMTVPAHADRYDRNIPVRRAELRDNYRGEQARRLDDLTARINQLYSDGRLSRDHRDRALDKLQRVRRDVRSRSRFDDDRYQANMDWLDSVSQDVDNWSSGDSRHFRNGRGDRYYDNGRYNDNGRFSDRYNREYRDYYGR